MSSPTVIPPKRFPNRKLALYLIPPMLMFLGWTEIRYVDQPYRSPTYRRTLAECAAHAAWTVPAEAAGPLVFATLALAFRLARSSHGYEIFAWLGPLTGTLIYAAFALLATKIGRRWDPLFHILLGAVWLLAGALILTALTSK